MDKPILIYNSLTRKKEEFVPVEEGQVKMYACGITVSGDAHIGHAYQAVIFDVIRKYLEYCGYRVTYVRNYTDVDDKIINKARELNVPAMEYANKMVIKTDEELKRLGIENATIEPRATENIEEMIEFISELINKGYAYATEYGDVFFSVKKFPQYGKLSNRLVEEEISGVRKEVEPGKIDSQDFALWKSAKEGEIYWESPWGKGRPGWHIECSAMSMKYLGETIDIHGGGKDLIFPHHENEIAQSESRTGKPFARYWIHNGLVKINGQKMSKSLGNGISLKELLDNYHPDIIRFTLLQNNYKSDLNIVDGIFETNEKHIYGFYKILNEIDQLTDEEATGDSQQNDDAKSQIENEFRDAMSNDFNTAVAIANLFGYFSKMKQMLEKKKDVGSLKAMKQAIIDNYRVLGILQHDPQKVIELIRDKYLTKHGITVEEIQSRINLRSDYKAKKDYANADAIKEYLANKGIVVIDKKGVTEWDIAF
ncbi:cysteine--tRNA ligase [Thermoclostridium caenicola]|uniref:Cysteine--tRNA ligase n=1 Tax=Thermoclostridium caenicola TaxID=659425 RepID=A0A1M6DQC6_9FIRM|nr:cysteine--tRNA ligase [Thermoclostridium caenicola]SHI75436.1 cysteinyl-tRNA synthetase [Thermoclostridium caenicola]HOL85416.1 cysteine--tRNA ligase [Thermoclostridium caenicola]HOP73061.1 cysteine--tRNA ligase [Thermoclostridium caenicola]HPO76842.1 cysteine--tRNA ligase [Thermoclostridium caenicola]